MNIRQEPIADMEDTLLEQGQSRRAAVVANRHRIATIPIVRKYDVAVPPVDPIHASFARLLVSCLGNMLSLGFPA